MDNAQVTVREIETVTGDFLTEAGEPFYRIEIDGYCADFDHLEAAENFAAAINQMFARHRLERSEPVGWMYTHPEQVTYGPDLQRKPEELRAVLLKHGWTEHPLYTTPPESVAEIERLREENERLRKMLVPQWFYADGYSSEDCNDSPHEVIEYLDLKPGKHVVSVDCAGPMPSIWCAVTVLTDEQMDEQETDDRVAFTEHASEDQARAALAALQVEP